MTVKFVDRHAWAHRLLTGENPPPTPPETELDGEEIARVEIEPDLPPAVVAAERAGLKLGLAIAAPLAGLAVLLAAIFFIDDPAIILLGAIAIFAAMILMGLPVWLAAVEDEIEEAEERDGIHHPPSIR